MGCHILLLGIVLAHGSNLQEMQVRSVGQDNPQEEDCPGPRIEPASLALAGGFFTAEPPGSPCEIIYGCKAALDKIQSMTLCYYAVTQAWVSPQHEGKQKEQL